MIQVLSNSPPLIPSSSFPNVVPITTAKGYQNVNVDEQKYHGVDMAPPNDNDLVDAKIAASEARSETKLARLEGKIDTAVATLLGELHGLRDDVRQTDQYSRGTRSVIFVTIVTATIALGGLIVAMATYGDALFGRGMNVRDVIQSTVKDTIENLNKTSPIKPPQ